MTGRAAAATTGKMAIRRNVRPAAIVMPFTLNELALIASKKINIQ